MPALHRWIRMGVLGTLALTGCQLPNALSDAPPGSYRPGELIVRWKEPARAAAFAQSAGLRILAGAEDSVSLLAVPEGEERSWAERLAREALVERAEPNFIKRTQQVPGSLRFASRPERAGAQAPEIAAPSSAAGRRLLFAPNDPGFSSNGQIAGQDIAWGLKAIHADTAWDATAGAPSITVAVIDTGVDMGHPDLAANLDAKNAINLVEPGRVVDDDFGHGTHVAGIIAAVGNNGQGSLGVAWKCKIMPIRVLGVDGSGSTYDTIAAIRHAVARGARVINMSLGSSSRSEVEAQAIQEAIAAKVVVVAAAGNEATVGNYLEYPASYPGVISVGAVGPDLKRAPFSNYNSQLSVAAPGVDIFSTLPRRMSSSLDAMPYGYLSGTSMASPVVAGVAALMLSVRPSWTPAQVLERLKKTSKDLSTDVPGFNVFTGSGLVDASRCVE